MKKLISCLLVVMMLFTATSVAAFAEPKDQVKRRDALTEFLNDTDLKTKDIALQIQSRDTDSDFVIHVDGDNLHLVTRNNGSVDGHVQLNPTGIYLGSDGKVTLLRYATIVSVMQDIFKEVDSLLEENIQSIPEEEAPSEAEIKEAVEQMAILASEAAAQEEADAATLSSAAIAFADNFKPEYILDVYEEDGAAAVSLRSEAFAVAFAEAMDELMSNPDLADLVDRKAALDGGITFAEMQNDWIGNREEILEAICSMESIETVEENGHLTSHFQVGGEFSEGKVLACDMDTWIDAQNGEAESAVYLGFEDEDPILVYEFAVNPYYYKEKLSSGDSMTEVDLEFDNNRISTGEVITVIDGNEEMRAYFAPEYFYIKGPKGCVTTTVRETWSGKTRYEVVAETAEGEESSFVLDFYQEGDSLVCELFSSEPDQSAIFKISRIDKVDIEDLSAAENINEITAEKIDAELESLLKMVIEAESADAEADK